MITNEELQFQNTPAGMSYVGKVIDNNDPHKRGRVKIVIPRFNNETELWAYPVSPIIGGGTGTVDNPSTESWGWYGAPQVGDSVLLIALDGDMNTLFYIGCINSRNQNLPEAKNTPDNLQLRLPNGHMLVFRTGADTSIELQTADGDFIKMDDANNRIQVDSGSSSIILNRNGTIVINSGTDTTINAANANITASGNTKITSTGTVDITGSTINLN